MPISILRPARNHMLRRMVRDNRVRVITPEKTIMREFIGGQRL